MDKWSSGAFVGRIDLTPVVALRQSRRGILAALGGGILTGVPIKRAFAADDVQASGNGKKRKKGKSQKKGKVRADVTCPGPRDDAFIINGGSRFAQTFTASVSGDLVRAELDLSHSASPDEYLLRLSPVDNSGVPTNDVLGISVVANTRVPDGESTVVFIFPNPPAIKSGTEYALVLSRSGGDTVSWLSRNDDVCQGRGFVGPGAVSAFEEQDGLDFIFSTFVRS
jgi:hypothetical protein